MPKSIAVVLENCFWTFLNHFFASFPKAPVVSYTNRFLIFGIDVLLRESVDDFQKIALKVSINVKNRPSVTQSMYTPVLRL